VFTIGRDAWRSLPAWPPSDVTPTSLYLRTDGGLSAEPPGPADIRPGTFRYDPADPLVESVGANCWSLATALVDRRRHDDRADILRYTGEPLAQDLEITGPVRARLYAATSAVDTDFTVTLCHVMADGAVSTIQDGIIRARYRNGHDAPEPVEPGAIVAYDIDLWATSYLVPAGDRLRVDVSSSCFDRFDRNLNTGEPTGHGTVPVVAEQAIHHSTLHPSSITLPVVATP
jgi:putative CocE/NonD family hydrolase